jgi:protein tyrosine phosphatase (PTP) superfamily phosphohydrolase (DUF442 family)
MNLTQKSGLHLLTSLTAISLAVSSCIQTPDITPRPTTWAQPIESQALPNLHRVSPDLYRCALPDEEGYAAARNMGIKTIVNLRPSKASQKPGGSISNYINIPVHTGSPTYDQAREFFKVIDDPKNQPVLLHCYHGADRTGAFTALYRINRQGWSKDEAIREMTGGGYQFHKMWMSLTEWVRDAPEF